MIDIKYNVDSQKVTLMMKTLKDATKNSKMMAQLGIQASKDMSKNFDKQVDDKGNKWKDLSPLTKALRGIKSSNYKILMDTGKGRQMDFKPIGKGVKVGSSKDYMEYHDVGAGVPKRKWAYLTKEALNKLKTIITKFLNEEMRKL
jgi:phage gpG-like protein